MDLRWAVSRAFIKEKPGDGDLESPIKKICLNPLFIKIRG